LLARAEINSNRWDKATPLKFDVVTQWVIGRPDVSVIFAGLDLALMFGKSHQIKA